MDGEDGELKVTNHPEKIGFTHDDGSRAKSSEATSHFDPKLSSREMRKIKYYEDMFAKMANENKGMTSETTNTQYTATPLQKPKSKVSERRRNADQKMEEGQANIGGYRPDSVDSTYGPTTTKSSRRSVYKKPAQATDTDYTGSKYINEASSSEYQYTDGKTLLDNKRLIRVQSMPMVTKKTKTTSYTDEKQHEEARSASARRPKVSRWDVKSSFAVPKTNRSPQVEPIAQEKPAVVDHKEEEEQDDTFSEGFGDMLIDEKEEQSTAESVEHTRERTGEYTETDQTEAYLENDARDLPLDVDDFLNEDLKEDGDLQEEEKEVIEEGEPGEEKEEDVEDQVNQEYADEASDQMPVEFETKLEDPYMMEQEQAQAQPKKKSNRGRKAKKKQEAYAVDAEQEGRVGFAEDLTPLSAQPEYMEELKQPGRRSKSQRSRKKKQDIYDEKAFNKTKPAAKGSKSIARNHSGSSEKTEKAAVSINKREFVDVVEEKFISTENLRMITMEEAERMLNICTKKNTDYEDAKKFIDNLMISKIEHEKRLEERNPFLLDPSNIVAPTPVYDRPKPEPVPENPLQISFKYRLFQTLSKV